MTVILGRKPQPLMKFRYRVFIPGFEEMGFTKVRGLRSEVPVLEVEEGGNQVPYKFPDRKVNFGNVLLETGLAKAKDLRLWFEEHLRWSRGLQSPIYRPVLITVLDKRYRPEKAWELFNAWPTIIESDGLDANSNDVVLQTIELANFGIASRNLGTGQKLSGGLQHSFSAFA